MPDLDDAVARARDLISFADGLEDAGQIDTARRSRMVARDLIEIAYLYTAALSVLEAAQANYQRCLDLLGHRAVAAMDAEVAADGAEAGDSNPLLDNREGA